MNYTGNKYGHLTLIGKVAESNKPGTVWMARCDCGNMREVLLKYVRAGRVKTCGKCELSRRLMSPNKSKFMGTEKAIQYLYNRFITKEMDRGRTYILPLNLYTRKIKENCVFCGAEPIQRKKGVRMKYNNLTFLQQNSTLQGITDSDYMSCCTTCNRWKGESNYLKFVDHVVKIVNNLASKANT